MVNLGLRPPPNLMILIFLDYANYFLWLCIFIAFSISGFNCWCSIHNNRCDFSGLLL